MSEFALMTMGASTRLGDGASTPLSAKLALLAMLPVGLAGCSGEPRSVSTNVASGEWVAEESASTDVKTVHTRSGSVWGGRARLVEELSIGVESGEDEYMFGAIKSLFADEDGIYVLDGQVPVLRVFDHEGRHVQDIGGEGEGPGEFQLPVFVTKSGDGRIFVLDMRRRESLIVYDEEGTPLEPAPVEGGLGRAFCCLHPMAALADGSVLVEIQVNEYYRVGGVNKVQKIDPDGTAGPVISIPRFGFEPQTFRLRRGFERRVPLAPDLVWAISPVGAIVVGVASEYRFEVRHLDGKRVVISREFEPVPVLEIEAEYYRRFIEGAYGWSDAGEKRPVSWSGEIPATKPAFTQFIPTASGEVWVRRPGPADVIEGCSLRPIRRSGRNRVPPRCHETNEIIDVFELSGRYLGEIELPEGLVIGGLVPFVRGDSVVAAVVDERHVSKVKRFRIVPPAPEEAGTAEVAAGTGSRSAAVTGAPVVRR